MAEKYQRLVVFCPGFDLRSARAHWRRQVREFARYSARTGDVVAVSDLQVRGAVHLWRAESRQVRCEFRLLDWTDLVAEIRGRTALARFCAGSRLLVEGMADGAFARVWRTDRNLGLALWLGFAPVLGFWLALPLVAVLAGSGAAVALLALVLLGLRRASASAYIVDIAQAAQAMARASDRALEARIEAFAQAIDGFGPAGRGEVVLVGHSLGCAMLLRVIARLRNLDLTFVSVGQGTQLVTSQRRGQNLLNRAFDAMRAQGVRWFDICARRDVLGFFRHDPGGSLAKSVEVDFNAVFGRALMRRLRHKPYEKHHLYFRENSAKTTRWNLPALLVLPRPWAGYLDDNDVAVRRDPERKAS